MKKLLSFILAALMLLSVVGCGVVDEQLAEDIIDIASDIYEETKEADTTPAPSEKPSAPDVSPEALPEVSPEADKPSEEAPKIDEPQAPAIDEDGEYSSKDEVALYIHTYGHLPKNFMKKKEAQALGWEGGSLEPYAPGCAIGGDRFGNYEGILPEGKYTECDIDTVGAKSRGAKRIVFSEDAIYYTNDHYETFTRLY